MKATRALTAAAFLLVGGVGLSGCNYVQNKISEKVTEKMVENATGGQFDIDQSDNEYTITTEDGTVNIGKQDISGVTAVVDLPDWITGGEQSGVMSSEADGKMNIYASLVSSRSVDETYAYFVQYLPDNDFSEISKADYAGTKMVSGSKGEDPNRVSMAVTINDNPDDEIDGVQVVIVYSGPAQE